MPDDQPLYMDISHHPLADATIDDVRRYPFPRGNDPTRFSGLRAVAQQLQSSGFAVCTGIGGVVYEYGWYLRGLEHWFMDMIENPAFCEAVLDRMLEFWTDYYTGFMAEVGGCVDVVMIGDDLAGQDGPLFRPDFYRRVVKPRQKALVQHIKKLTSAKIWYHTCGGCVEYIPELIDNGVDILNPVQISARGMDPADLKRRFGDKIVFWGGGIDSQHILPFASPQQVRDAGPRATSPPSNPMADLYSTMSTTSRPASPPKISSPSSTPPTNSAVIDGKKMGSPFLRTHAICHSRERPALDLIGGGNPLLTAKSYILNPFTSDQRPETSDFDLSLCLRALVVKLLSLRIRNRRHPDIDSLSAAGLVAMHRQRILPRLESLHRLGARSQPKHNPLQNP